jgi:hypothetical protein
MKNDNKQSLLNKSSSSLNSVSSPYYPIQTTDTVPNSNYVKKVNNYKTKKQKYVYLLTQPSISSSVRLRKKAKKIINKNVITNELGEFKTHLRHLTDKINYNQKQIEDLRSQAYQDNLVLKSIKPSTPIHILSPSNKKGFLRLKQKSTNIHTIDQKIFGDVSVDNKKIKRNSNKLDNDYLYANQYKIMNVVNFEIKNDKYLSLIEQKDFTIRQLTSKIEMYTKIISELRSHSNINEHCTSDNIEDLKFKLKEQMISSDILKHIAEEEQLKLKKCKEIYKEIKYKNNVLVQEIRKLLEVLKNNNINVSNILSENKYKGQIYCLLENNENDDEIKIFNPHIKNDIHNLYKNGQIQSRNNFSKNHLLTKVDKYNQNPLILENIILGFEKNNNNQAYKTN